MNNIIVTVVIPIYNVAQYLDRCMTTIVNQTYKNLDIIMVDDGSLDECSKKCEYWAETDYRIRVIHKKNAGLGMARNSGIDIAKGRYICFFDSDDFVREDTIEKCIQSAIKYESEIIKFGYQSLNSQLEIMEVKTPMLFNEYYEGEEVYSKILHGMIGADTKYGKAANINMSAWGAMFSMELIERSNWRFVSEREYISEDFYSLFQLFTKVRKVSIVKEAFYFYCYNENSLTHTFDRNRMNRINNWHHSMEIFWHENYDLSFLRSDIASQYIGSVIGCAKLLYYSKEKNKYYLITNIFQNKYLLEVVFHINLKEQPFFRGFFIWCLKHKLSFFNYLMIAFSKNK